MLWLDQISLRFGEKLLFNSASQHLACGQKVGLVGINGAGKSTLISVILGERTLDAGEMRLSPRVRIAHLAQAMPQSAEEIIDYVKAGHLVLAPIFAALKQAELANDMQKVAELHSKIYALHGYDLTAEAAKILLGLGFTAELHHRSVNSFSGGWKMRLNLARLLISGADLLLLDEPTNHLDLNAIIWLADWLKHYAGTFLLVSHDRDFLDETVSTIWHVDQAKIVAYNGNYSAFERLRAEKLAVRQKEYQHQQQQIAHLTSFVERFRYKASKAKQAQSRLKMLERLKLVTVVNPENHFNFSFLPGKIAGNPLLKVQDLTVGYKDNQPILEKVNLTLGPEDAIAILGKNGSGKSTLVKALVGELPAFSGEIIYHPKIKIAYFSQDQVEKLASTITPLDFLHEIDPEATELSLRSFLGQFAFREETVFQKIGTFSGGEKARLVLARLIWQRPNLLVLDEPTNHLDLTMREALALALQSYHGALILIAHDSYLLKHTVNEFYLIEDKKVRPFSGTLADYHDYVLENQVENHNIVKKVLEGEDEILKAPSVAHKKINHYKLAKIEEEIFILEAEQQNLTAFIADRSHYEKAYQAELAAQMARSREVAARIKELEQEWDALVAGSEK